LISADRADTDEDQCEGADELGEKLLRQAVHELPPPE
jgi:hypothetical protein